MLSNGNHPAELQAVNPVEEARKDEPEADSISSSTTTARVRPFLFTRAESSVELPSTAVLQPTIVRRASVCSELGSDRRPSSLTREPFKGSMSTLSTAAGGQRRQSIIESLEKKYRENVSNRIRNLQQRASVSGSDLPVIVPRRPEVLLPRPAPRRSIGYQTVILGPFAGSSSSSRVEIRDSGGSSCNGSQESLDRLGSGIRSRLSWGGTLDQRRTQDHRDDEMDQSSQTELVKSRANGNSISFPNKGATLPARLDRSSIYSDYFCSAEQTPLSSSKPPDVKKSASPSFYYSSAGSMSSMESLEAAVDDASSPLHRDEGASVSCDDASVDSFTYHPAAAAAAPVDSLPHANITESKQDTGCRSTSPDEEINIYSSNQFKSPAAREDTDNLVPFVCPSGEGAYRPWQVDSIAEEALPSPVSDNKTFFGISRSSSFPSSAGQSLTCTVPSLASTDPTTKWGKSHNSSSSAADVSDDDDNLLRSDGKGIGVCKNALDKVDHRYILPPQSKPIRNGSKMQSVSSADVDPTKPRPVYRTAISLSLSPSTHSAASQTISKHMSSSTTVQTPTKHVSAFTFNPRVSSDGMKSIPIQLPVSDDADDSPPPLPTSSLPAYQFGTIPNSFSDDDDEFLKPRVPDSEPPALVDSSTTWSPTTLSEQEQPCWAGGMKQSEIGQLCQSDLTSDTCSSSSSSKNRKKEEDGEEDFEFLNKKSSASVTLASLPPASLPTSTDVSSDVFSKQPSNSELQRLPCLFSTPVTSAQRVLDQNQIADGIIDTPPVSFSDQTSLLTPSQTVSTGHMTGTVTSEVTLQSDLKEIKQEVGSLCQDDKKSAYISGVPIPVHIVTAAGQHPPHNWVSKDSRNSTDDCERIVRSENVRNSSYSRAGWSTVTSEEEFVFAPTVNQRKKIVSVADESPAACATKVVNTTSLTRVTVVPVTRTTLSSRSQYCQPHKLTQTDECCCTQEFVANGDKNCRNASQDASEIRSTDRSWETYHTQGSSRATTQRVNHTRDRSRATSDGVSQAQNNTRATTTITNHIDINHHISRSCSVPVTETVDLNQDTSRVSVERAADERVKKQEVMHVNGDRNEVVVIPVQHETSTNVPQQQHQCRLHDDSNDGTFEVVITKSGLGLTFCIEGGKGSLNGDRPITVKRVFRAGEPLRPGDEIVSANGKRMAFLSHFVAWNYLKSLPEGPVHLVVRRTLA